MAQQLQHNVVFTGSRTWVHEPGVCKVLDTLDPLVHTIVHGHAPHGLDPMVDRLARARNFRVVRVPANWRRYKLAAGPRRNAEMLARYKPCIVYAFVRLHPTTGLPTSGTTDCIAKANALSIRVVKKTKRK